MRILDHGEIEISNNQAENAIRPIVVGRKNWLFCDTQAGAEPMMIFTMLETVKANGLNPETYLNHILTVLPDRFARTPGHRLRPVAGLQTSTGSLLCSVLY